MDDWLNDVVLSKTSSTCRRTYCGIFNRKEILPSKISSGVDLLKVSDALSYCLQREEALELQHKNEEAAIEGQSRLLISAKLEDYACRDPFRGLSKPKKLDSGHMTKRNTTSSSYTTAHPAKSMSWKILSRTKNPMPSRLQQSPSFTVGI
jgi:hypothetical protein